MMGVGATTVGMVGVFAFPAYAVPDVEGTPDGLSASQSFVTEDADASIPAGKVSAQAVPVVQAPTENQGATAAVSASWFQDIPAGAGAQGLVAAARAQVGVNQDCTDLVQNALAKIGLTTSRLNGGPDLGIGSFYAFGHRVTDGKFAPGDILIWPGQHVAVYIGNGMAVHGGYGGNRTVIAGYASPNAHPDVVRIG